MNEHKLRVVSLYKEDDNKVIHIITNNLDWTARTIVDLYKNDGISSYFSKLLSKICKKTRIYFASWLCSGQKFTQTIAFLY